MPAAGMFRDLMDTKLCQPRYPSVSSSVSLWAQQGLNFLTTILCSYIYTCLAG